MMGRKPYSVKFTSSSDEDITIDIFDVRGRAIFNKKYANTTNFTQELNVSSAETGLYMVRINDGERVTVKKLIVQ